MLRDAIEAPDAPRILIVDDDPVLRRMLRFLLIGEKYAVAAAGSAEQALDLLQRDSVDLIVLDVTLPGMNGYQFCRTLRERQMTLPVLFLSARQHVDDTVAGFDAGADDYLPKPFAFAELIARVRALARRAQPAVPPVLTRGDIWLDPGKRVASRGGRRLDLSPKELAVLELLLDADGRVVSAETLLERAWDEAADPFSNTVKVTVSRLRRKLGDPPVIETVPHAGYRL